LQNEIQILSSQSTEMQNEMEHISSKCEQYNQIIRELKLEIKETKTINHQLILSNQVEIDEGYEKITKLNDELSKCKNELHQAKISFKKLNEEYEE